MAAVEWETRFEAELRAAEAARAAGNEGKARVCARRAAGIAIGEFLRRQECPAPSPSAYDRLRFVADHPALPPAARRIVAHLVLRVDENFQLPEEIDLIAEARALPAVLKL